MVRTEPAAPYRSSSRGSSSRRSSSRGSRGDPMSLRGTVGEFCLRQNGHGSRSGHRVTSLPVEPLNRSRLGRAPNGTSMARGHRTPNGALGSHQQRGVHCGAGWRCPAGEPWKVLPRQYPAILPAVAERTSPPRIARTDPETASRAGNLIAVPQRAVPTERAAPSRSSVCRRAPSALQRHWPAETRRRFERLARASPATRESRSIERAARRAWRRRS